MGLASAYRNLRHKALEKLLSQPSVKAVATEKLIKSAPVSEIPIGDLLHRYEVRDAIISTLKKSFFHELNIVMPVSTKLACPLYYEMYSGSFLEMFVEQEYGPAFESMPLPRRWLDIGCHAGFFTLYLIWLQQKSGERPRIDALLIDGDPRSREAIDKLKATCDLDGQIAFKQGLITDNNGSFQFTIRDNMLSAITDAIALNQPDEGDYSEVVKTVDEQEIMSLLPPPYDLIKLDVEGAEYEFFTSYKKLLGSTRYLLMEWHSWHKGGGGMKQICEMASQCGFDQIKEVMKPRATTLEDGGKEEQVGLLLFEKRR